MIRNLMAAFDGSESANDALDFAVELARAFAVPLHVLMVARPLEYTVSVEIQSDEDQARLHCEKVLQQARAKLEAAPFPTHISHLIGQPAEQIVRYADSHRIDHIVMGHRGHTRFERWLIGSVAKQVVAHASCAVTVFRSPSR
jgi:nucleotide-binding universal stress UspA family protein